VNTLFVFSTLQKLPIAISLVLHVTVFFSYPRFRKSLYQYIPFIIGAFAMILVFQWINAWTNPGVSSFGKTLQHFLFRTAEVFPFYSYVYPNFEPFQGMDLILDGKSPNDNLVVFSYMYPGTVGASAGPSFLRSYSQNGTIYACLDLMFVSLNLVLMGRIWTFVKNVTWISSGFYALSVLFALQVTQTRIQDAFLASGGILLGSLLLFFLITGSRMLRTRPSA